MNDNPPGEEPDWNQYSWWSRLLSWKVLVPTVLLLLAVVLSPFAYRHWRLAQVPDIGDPFPVAELLEPIPDEENAYLLFEEAYALLKDVSDENREEYENEAADGWHRSDDQLNEYLEMNRPALRKWLEATEREDYQKAVIRQPIEVWAAKVRANRILICWSRIEIERLTRTGNPADALPWLRASFRCSGLVTRKGTVMDRLTGAAFFLISARSTEEWMQHPEITHDQLLDLLSIVRHSARLVEKPSTTIQADYLAFQQECAGWTYGSMKETYADLGSEPPLDSAWETWLMAEPEFSRRLGAHLASNLLAFADESRRTRPPLLDGDIFDESAVGVALKRRLPAQKLTELLKEAKLFNAEKDALSAGYLASIDRQQAIYACLQVALAAQSYYRNRGELPDRLADLQPDYLASLPDDPYASQPMPVLYQRINGDAYVSSRFTNEEVNDGGAVFTFDEAMGVELHKIGFRIQPPGVRTEGESGP